jgi:hypothetical protein
MKNNFNLNIKNKKYIKNFERQQGKANQGQQQIKKMTERNNKGLNFDLNDEKELTDYNELTYEALIGNKIKNEKNILYKIAMTTAINDISKADINEFKEPRGKDELKFLNNIFIDNIVLSSISQKTTKKDDIGFYNTLIRRHFQPLFGEKKQQKIMCICENTDKNFLTKSNIKDYQEMMNSTLKGEKDYYKTIEYKLTLNDIDINKALKYLKGDYIKALKNKCVYLHDIDFTRDIGFSFDTNNLLNEMIDNYDFHYDGEKHKRIIVKEYDNEISFWFIDEDIEIRVKIYNKFIQMIESPAVRSSFGSHICKWINNKNKMINEAIDKSLNVGYSRLELTFYTPNGELPKNEVVERNFNEIYDMIKNISSQSIFYNSINNQFTAIMTCIYENLIIYDKTRKHLLLVRWFNSLSLKMNGILFKKISCISNRIINIIGKMTFNNVPIRIITIEYEDKRTNQEKEKDDEEKDDEENDEEENGELIEIDKEEIEDDKEQIDIKQLIKINVRTYLKTGYNKTLLTDKSEQYKITKNDNQPEQRGIDYGNMNFEILTEDEGTKKDNNNIFFKQIITNKKIEYLQQKEMMKKKNLKRSNQNEMNEQIERFIKITEAKNEEFKEYQQKRLQTINKLNEIDNDYKTKGAKSFKDFNYNDEFFISSYIKRSEKNILIYDEIRRQWIYSNEKIIDFINDIYINHYNRIKYIEYDERKIYYYTTSNDDIDLMAKMKYNKIYKDKQKNKKYDISIINNITKEEYNEITTEEQNEEETTKDNNKIYEINDEINRKFTTDFDKLDMGEVYELIGITKRKFRSTEHYYIHIKYKNKIILEGTEPKIYIVNYWLKKILNEIDYKKMIDGEPLKFKLLKGKTTGNKTIENIIEIDENIINQYKL